MTITIERKLLDEIERALGELVDDPRAGWGNEPFIECLYCGERDKDFDAPTVEHSHEIDCPVRRGRTLREALRRTLEADEP